MTPALVEVVRNLNNVMAKNDLLPKLYMIKKKLLY